MNTITQTVTIEPSRRVSLNFAVPDDFPLGMADVSIQIQPCYMPNQSETLNDPELTEEMLQRRLECLRSRRFVSRTEWGQYADKEIRQARDNDRV